LQLAPEAILLRSGRRQQALRLAPFLGREQAFRRQPRQFGKVIAEMVGGGGVGRNDRVLAGS
jgi:hypothetical protein